MENKIERCFSLIKKTYETEDGIMRDFYRAEALVAAKEIAQEKYPQCGNDRAYSVYFIFCSAAEMGKTISELCGILKAYGILSE